MKQEEFTKCAQCGKGMAAEGVHFYRVKVEQMILKPAAIQRQHGLETMIGNAALAGVLGLNEDLAAPVAAATVLVCGTCGVARGRPVHLYLETEEEGG